jgi:hypothetical protein
LTGERLDELMRTSSAQRRSTYKGRSSYKKLAEEECFMARVPAADLGEVRYYP